MSILYSTAFIVPKYIFIMTVYIIYTFLLPELLPGLFGSQFDRDKTPQYSISVETNSKHE